MKKICKKIISINILCILIIFVFVSNSFAAISVSGGGGSSSHSASGSSGGGGSSSHSASGSSGGGRSSSHSASGSSGGGGSSSHSASGSSGGGGSFFRGSVASAGGGGTGFDDEEDNTIDNDDNIIDNDDFFDYSNEKRPQSRGPMAASAGTDENGNFSHSFYDVNGELYSSYTYDKNNNVIDKYERDDNNNLQSKNIINNTNNKTNQNEKSVVYHNGYYRSNKKIDYVEKGKNFSWKKNTINGKWQLNSQQDDKIDTVKDKLYRDEKNGNIYCFDGDGNMVTGWYQDSDNNYFYFSEIKDSTEGSLCSGTRIIDGKVCYFGADGHLIGYY